MAELVFEVGETVVATGDVAPYLTSGKQYTVIEYTPQVYAGAFTWPAAVTVVSDTGWPVSGHTHRFRRLEDPCSTP